MYIGVDCGAQSLLTRTPNPTASLPMTRPMPVTVRPLRLNTHPYALHNRPLISRKILHDPTTRRPSSALHGGR